MDKIRIAVLETFEPAPGGWKSVHQYLSFVPDGVYLHRVEVEGGVEVYSYRLEMMPAPTLDGVLAIPNPHRAAWAKAHFRPGYLMSYLPGVEKILSSIVETGH
jgi:hypothetical protein